MRNKCEMVVKCGDAIFQKGDFIEFRVHSQEQIETGRIVNILKNQSHPYDVQFFLSSRPAYECLSERDIAYMEKIEGK